MTILHQYATELIRKKPGDLWREDAIASLTTTTVVSNALAVGGWSNDKFAGQFAWRPDTTTTADKTRYVTAYASSTGTLTHAGTNYSDTTATSENVIVTKVEPYTIRQAIDSAIRRLKTIDRTEMPVVFGQGAYSLGDLTWIRQPSDIVRVCYNHSPVITRNRYLQKRNSVDSSGRFLPDWWTVADNAATSPYQTGYYYRGNKYAYSLERAGGTDATLLQEFSTLATGAPGDYPSGETLTVVVKGVPGGSGTLKVENATASATSSGTSLQEVTASATLASSSVSNLMYVETVTSNTVNIIHEAYAFIGDTITDQIRRDDFREYELNRSDWDFDQNGVLTGKFPKLGRGQILIYSRRPYPGFDATRLISGAADADSSDAPIDAVCAGALSRIYFGLEGETSPNYLYWEDQFSQMARKHTYKYAAGPDFGFPLVPGPRRLR